MPRKQRIEYPGAIYHVISRGNYLKELFLRQNTWEAFERCLFEAVDRCGWKLHAHVVMSNHFHLVVETPEPNLVVGMKWLQSTFATRFNRLRKERGHVFQGRSKRFLLARIVPYSAWWITSTSIRFGRRSARSRNSSPTRFPAIQNISSGQCARDSAGAISCRFWIYRTVWARCAVTRNTLN